MKILSRLIIVLLGLLLQACATDGHLVRNSDRSMKEIRTAFVAVAGEPRKESANKRTFESEYFPRNPDNNFKANKARERLFGRFVILGDMRPYDVQVEVVIEVRTPDGYEEVGVDEALSHELANSLKKELIKSSEGRNVIDDFRPF